MQSEKYWWEAPKFEACIQKIKFDNASPKRHILISYVYKKVNPKFIFKIS